MISVRTHLLNLILGAAGSTYTIASGRFHARPDDSSLHYSAMERGVRVQVTPIGHEDGYNSIDGFSFDRYLARISIWYIRTNAGGDYAEGLTEQHGPGTEDAIYDRWISDVHDITTVIRWHENHGSTPPIIVVRPRDGGGELVQEGNLLRGDLLMELVVKANRPGAYVP